MFVIKVAVVNEDEGRTRWFRVDAAPYAYHTLALARRMAARIENADDMADGYDVFDAATGRPAPYPVETHTDLDDFPF